MSFLKGFFGELQGAAQQSRNERLQETMNANTQAYRQEQAAKEGLSAGRTEQYLKFEQALNRLMDNTLQAGSLITVAVKAMSSDAPPTAQTVAEVHQKVTQLLNTASEELELIYNAGVFFDDIPHMKVMHANALAAIAAQRQLARAFTERPRLSGEAYVPPEPAPTAAPGPAKKTPEDSIVAHRQRLTEIQAAMREKFALIDGKDHSVYYDRFATVYHEVRELVKMADNAIASMEIPDKMLGFKYAEERKVWKEWFHSSLENLRVYTLPARRILGSDR